MYLKQNDTYVTNDFSYLPIKDLKVADEIVVMQEKQTGIFTLSEISKNKLMYLFQGLETNIHHNFDEDYINGEDEEPTVIENNAWLDTNKASKLHLLLYGNLFSLERSSRDINMPEAVKAKDFNDAYNKIYQNIYGVGGNFLTYQNKFSNNERHYCYVAFEIDDENALIFLTSNHIESKKRHWVMSKECYLFNKNGDSYCLSNHFRDLYSKVKEKLKETYYVSSLVENNIRDFENVLKVMDKKVPVSKEKIEERVWDTYFQFKNWYELDEIRELFSPVYTSSVMDFKVYISEFYNHFPSDASYSYNDSLISQPHVEIHPEKHENAEALMNEMRIGEAMYNFYFSSYFNPLTGEFREDENNRNKIVYKDVGGLIVHNTGNFSNDTHYYVKIRDYYVKADTRKDKNVIEELVNRKNIVDKLYEAL